MGAALPEIALPAGTRVIADLHLDPLQAIPWEAFRSWLARLGDAPALVVLGDLFEYWIGAGQAREAQHAALLAQLSARARAGTALHFLHGNRDFLLGHSFEQASGGRVHPGGLLGRTAAGTRILFLHGDELATLDRSYQRLRAVVRTGALRRLANAAPAGLSAAVARALRRRSRRAVAGKPPATVALQEAAAAEWCARHGASWLVCGHAHRFRDQRLAGGARWLVLDAFGGARDVLVVSGEGELEVEGSDARRSQRAEPSLSSGARMIIALDGPAGVGKSSVARRLARALGFFFLDTGAMYRAVTLSVLGRGLAPTDAEACTRVARGLALDFDAEGRVRIDGEPGEPAIRSPEVTAAVSQVSAHPGVRECVVARQRALVEERPGIVAEGRDTTTVVFPGAMHKFYLTASVDERARRRALQQGTPEQLAEIRADIERRDALDSTRVHSPLRAAKDARRIETDGRSLEEVVELLLAHVRGGLA